MARVEGSVGARLAEVARTTPSGPKVLTRIFALDDFEIQARRKLPWALYGFISGGTETNAAVRAALDSYREFAIRPRTLPGKISRTLSTTIFDRTYDMPFGIPPMGGINLSAQHGDTHLASAALETNIPFILSGSALTPLEKIIQVNPNTWFQAYLNADLGMIKGLIDRIAAAGYGTLVVTVDMPCSANRENNARNGYTSPLRATPRLTWDAINHPRWLIGTWFKTLQEQGMPHMENTGAERGTAIFSSTVTRAPRASGLGWEDLKWIRDYWKGRLVIKGILASEDARTACDMGIEGLIISSHGGRQLDYAIAPLRVLPEIAAEVGSEMTVMLDGGVRRGTDVIKAMALGAKAVFIGRPFIYSVAVGGKAGALHAINLVKQEIDRDLTLAGMRELSDVSPVLLRHIPIS